MNALDLEEIKRRRVILGRRMVAQTRRAYDTLLSVAKSGKDREIVIHFLKWHLISYVNYLEALEVDEEHTKSDWYADYIRAMLSNPWILKKLPPLPFWTPSVVSSEK